MSWTPASGARSLAARVGQGAADKLLFAMLRDEIPGHDLVLPPYRNALVDIGDGHARRLMADENGARLLYWPRVWAARALAYIGSQSAGPALVAGLSDSHWRVRMTCAQTLGRLRIDGVVARLVDALDDDHERVRAAALAALGRVGDATALSPLMDALRADPGNRSIEAAVLRINQRLP